MKTINFISAIILLVIFSFGCKDSDTIPVKMTATLGTKEWKAVVRKTYLDKTTNTFSIIGTSISGEVLNATVHGTKPGTYWLTIDSLKAQVWGTYKASVNQTEKDIYLSKTGMVELTKVDTVAMKISGKFEFKVRNLTDSIIIKNGVFSELKYEITNNQ